MRLTRYAQRVSTRTAIVVATVVASVSCLAGLGYQPLSWDEAVTANAASRSLPALWRLVSHTDAPLAVYYLAMHCWTVILAGFDVSPTEGWLRLPSALAGVAAVALTARLAAQLFTPVIGLAAGLLLAVDPLFVFYAHDARPYTLVTFCVLVSTTALRRALARPTLARLAVYGASGLLVLYIHLFAVFVLVVHALIIWRHRPVRRRFVAVGVALVAAIAPLLWLASRETGEIGWVPRPGLASVASFLSRVVGWPAVVAVPLLIASLLPAVRTRLRGTDGAGDGRVLILLWAVLPPAALIAVSFTQPVLVARYALVAVPGIMIGLAVLLGRARAGIAVGLGLAILVVAGASAVVQQVQPYKYEDFRAAADVVTDSAQHGDGLVFLPASYRVGYDEYLRPDRSDPVRSVASDFALSAPAGWRRDDIIGGQECDSATLAGRFAGHQRIFLVGSPLTSSAGPGSSADERTKEQILTRQYQRLWQVRYGDVTVTLLVRDAGPGSAGVTPDPGHVGTVEARQRADMPGFG